MHFASLQNEVLKPVPENIDSAQHATHNSKKVFSKQCCDK
jgi:hypothetical protein